MHAEFGGKGLPSAVNGLAVPGIKASVSAQENTTIAIIATDAKLDKAGAQRLSIAAHDGFARALVPAHTPFDGDLVFTAATGEHDGPITAELMMQLCHAASVCMARAIARGVYEAAR
jgi:L-aminopeptidase/D-esterase-like protein